MMLSNSLKHALRLGLFPLIMMLTSACGPEDEKKLDAASADKDFVDRFNVVARDIRDFPKSKKSVEQYFNIWTTASTWKDAKVIMFGEQHDFAANQIWSAGALNKVIKEGDVVLFEGCQSGTAIGDITSAIVRRIFVAREFENIKLNYKPDSGIKIWQKHYEKSYNKMRRHLETSQLNFQKAKGYCWDTEGDYGQRNTAMVSTIKKFLTGQNRVFVIAGAFHTPHYAFADALSSEKRRTAFLAHPGALSHEINDAFYDYFQTSSGKKDKYASTRVIYDYLKNQDFAVMIPKNILNCSSDRVYCPNNAR